MVMPTIPQVGLLLLAGLIIYLAIRYLVPLLVVLLLVGFVGFLAIKAYKKAKKEA